MWAERYILVTDGNSGADAGRGRMQEEPALEDTETDVAIEDDW
jgi:hypothetical protein